MLPPHYTRAFAITPSDTVNFTQACHGIYVGATGDVTLVDLTGTVVLFKGVPVGTTLRVAAKRVNATATTATSLVGLGCN